MLHPRWILGLWIVTMLPLCGGEDTCWSVLTLDPPEVVGELGDNFLVNCTSFEEEFDEIFWTYGSTESEREDVKSFTLLSMSLSEWDVAVKCTVKLNSSFECSTDLKITVYKTPELRLSFPHPIYDKSDYELRCEVRNVAPVQNLRVTWFTGNQTLRTDTFDKSSVTPVNVTSTLNITTDKRLNGQVFGCKAELDLGPLEPEFQPPTQLLEAPLDVLYPPVIQQCPGELIAVEPVHSLDMLPCSADGNPAVTHEWFFGGELVDASEPLTRGRSGEYEAVFMNFLGVFQISVTVKVQYPPEVTHDIEELVVDEGANVSLDCEAHGVPLFFNWTCDGQNMNVSASVLNVTHVMTNRSCSCVVHNYLGAASKIIRLHVAPPPQPFMPSTVAPPKPATADAGCPLMLTPAEVAVRFGDPVTINCTSSTAAVQGIVWEVPTGEVNLVDTVATWSVRQMTRWGGKTRCILNLGHRLCSMVPNITLYKPPDNVLVRIPDLMLEGVDYQLTCDIINVAPVQNLKVKWFHRSEDLGTQTFNETTSTPLDVSSTITVTAKAGDNGGSFRCEAELDLGPNGPEPPPRAMGEASAVVHYRPVFRGCPEIFSGLENVVNLHMVPCQADGNPAAPVQWYHQGKVINASEPLGRMHSGEYVAKAENDMGTSTLTLNISVEHEPSLSCEPSYEVAENDELQSVCTPEGRPRPVVSWFRDGKELRSSHQWKKEDSGNYLLRATNKRGTAEHNLYLNVLYAPHFGKGNSTVEVTRGENVILECSADGNPSPEIRWSFRPAANVANTTGWRRSILTVNEATSANAGVYVCVATNKVGSVMRFDTLRVQADHSSTFLPQVFWGMLIFLAILMVIGLIVCFATCKTRSKHRRYSFIPSSSRNDSERSFPLHELPVWMHT